MPSILLSISPCNSPSIAHKLHHHNKKKKKKKNHYNKLRRNQTSDTTDNVQSFQQYVRTGRMHDARVQFDAKSKRTLVEYTTLMSGYILHGHSMEAMLLLHDMLHLPFSFVLDPFAVSASLRACASTGSLHCGQELHCLVLKMGYFEDLFVANALVYMYSDCGSLSDAELVFREIKQPDLVSWSSMLSGYMKNGRDKQVLRLIGEMSVAGVQFDAFVLSIALKVAANLGVVATGMQLHCYTVKMGLDSCTFLMNSLMDFYGRSCRLSEMRKVFDGLFHKDLVSWNTAISCYTDDHQSYEALDLFHLLMLEGFECDDYTLGSVLQAVTDLSSLDHGREIHGYVIKAGFWCNSYVISALLVMYIECNDNNSLLPLKLFRYLYAIGEEELLDGFVMASILKFCASRMDLEIGKMIHSCILKQGMKTNPFVSSSLVDMYAKCGIPEASLWVFAGIAEPGVVSWSAIIAGQCSNGRFQEALHLFQAMQSDSVKANEFTLTAAIQACAALRDLRSGKEIHCSLIRAGYSSNASVLNSLIGFYFEIRQPQQALNLWTLSCEDDNPWNSLMRAFSKLIDNGSIIKLLTDIHRSNSQINASLAYYVLDACRSPSLLHADVDQ
ncbi:pentatricopeptide repeat-containing protein At2g03380, mitochondrial-like [Dioscorea cayenensis subsp. rotundata]|uniref:Pentatricopeptide repeat-containing protein At2g03380, mitochondrial-like n=1 Tax=Dioscorea cayennensis subsp. rotundata TaxID=55577 RepID=A0AB40BDS7_DIOCR|nr:pentatricopeptide repeat-containing protein At2g03380, mitochondrial-like [Dioscorea cayenensis subsp. rotundata]